MIKCFQSVCYWLHVVTWEIYVHDRNMKWSAFWWGQRKRNLVVTRGPVIWQSMILRSGFWHGVSVADQCGRILRHMLQDDSDSSEDSISSVFSNHSLRSLNEDTCNLPTGLWWVLKNLHNVVCNFGNMLFAVCVNSTQWHCVYRIVILLRVIIVLWNCIM